jgi:hypothetical protein
MSELPSPVQMDPVARSRVRWAAFLAPRLYPDPVGTLLARELFAWEHLGYIGGHSQISKLAEFLIAKAAAEDVQIAVPERIRVGRAEDYVPEAGVP